VPRGRPQTSRSPGVCDEAGSVMCCSCPAPPLSLETPCTGMVRAGAEHRPPVPEFALLLHGFFARLLEAWPAAMRWGCWSDTVTHRRVDYG
jgi:hypothetical protein